MSKTPKPKAFRVRIHLKNGSVLKLRLTKLELTNNGNTIKWSTPNAALDPHLVYLDPSQIAAIVRRPQWRP